ncbi:MAG: oxidoreductase [Hydrocarboniphaga sp.]|uniref:FAD-dependent oxidoreductase n=1 Tax=Hydrocarboniphaga sp. TaxID=2033016 RepID=UPI00261BC3C8|nr:FAD-dependent oxidoreductase [Hydrocarboniphaga sp.]MDB5971882.1 oxidoreductase [Hydrocarboniphaga sp.]
MAEQRPLRVAIVGSGPSGMYAAGHLLENPAGTFMQGRLIKRVNRPIEVDVLDRLPTPWGLIRGGVAPDHPDKKKMSRVYDAIAHRPGFRFIGNVNVGESVTTQELSHWYDAVIYAFGADGERRLGIPGEDLPGCSSARRFVGWYNGHPDFSHLPFDLRSQRAVIIGNGNVSMDVARILLKPVDELRRTDIAAHALEALARSQVREVVILGRRGPEDAAYNFPELEELGDLPDTAIVVEDENAARAVLACGPGSAEKMQVLKHLLATRRSGSRRIVLRFHTSPVALIGDNRVEGIRIAPTSNPDAGNEVLTTGMVLAAVGYRGRSLPGLPFDEARGVVPSQCGRVMDGPNPVSGAYVTGWIRRGPQGIIGSNKKCARDCVEALMADAESAALPRQGTLDAKTTLTKFAERTTSTTSFADWQRIDMTERAEGLRLSRPRVKLTTFNELMAMVS